MWKEEVNAKGGVVKRKVEVKYLDSQAKIEEAVRMAREAAASKEVDLLVESCSSREAFSVKEVSRDLNLLTIAPELQDDRAHRRPQDVRPYPFPGRRPEPARHGRRGKIRRRFCQEERLEEVGHDRSGLRVWAGKRHVFRPVSQAVLPRSGNRDRALA